MTYCAIPNIILQQTSRLLCYEVCENSDGEETVAEATFNITKRNRPEDYVYTEQEHFTVVALENRLTKVEESAHVHKNKDALDSITNENVKTWNNNAELAHTHENKEQLDTITEEDLETWRNPNSRAVTGGAQVGTLFKELEVTTTLAEDASEWTGAASQPFKCTFRPSPGQMVYASVEGLGVPYVTMAKISPTGSSIGETVIGNYSVVNSRLKTWYNDADEHPSTPNDTEAEWCFVFEDQGYDTSHYASSLPTCTLYTKTPGVYKVTVTTLSYSIEPESVMKMYDVRPSTFAEYGTYSNWKDLTKSGKYDLWEVGIKKTNYYNGVYLKEINGTKYVYVYHSEQKANPDGGFTTVEHTLTYDTATKTVTCSDTTINPETDVIISVHLDTIISTVPDKATSLGQPTSDKVGKMFTAVDHGEGVTDNKWQSRRYEYQWVDAPAIPVDGTTIKLNDRGQLTLAQEILSGTTDELTPTQVYNAVSEGIPVKVQYTDETYGLLSFTAFNVAESSDVLVSQTIVYYNDGYILIELFGSKSLNVWGLYTTTLAQKSDIPSKLPNPNALTFTGAATGNYDGSSTLTVEIPTAADGKSAYEYAVEGGYTGTEEEFSTRLAQEIPAVDSTLTQSGQAADAAAVGDRLSALSDEKANQADVDKLKGDVAAITPDDAAVNGKPWTSKKIVDTICQPFEESGNPVHVYPVENYPLGVRVSWEPTQAGEGDPSPDNIRPITGRDAVSVTRCGKNLSETNAFGDVKWAYQNKSIDKLVSSLTAGTYKISFTITLNEFSDKFTSETAEAKGLYARYYVYDGSEVVRNIFLGPPQTIYRTDTLPKSANVSADINIAKEEVGYKKTIYFYSCGRDSYAEGAPNGTLGIAEVSNLQIELGSTATPYEPYTGSTTSIALPETVYGGEVDAVTGDGKETWKTLTLDGTTNAFTQHGEFWDLPRNSSPGVIDDFNKDCSHFPNGSFGGNQRLGLIFTTAKLIGKYFQDISALNAYLAAQYAAGTPVQVCYKLAEPVPFTATGIQPIPALRGVNTIYTDADGVVVTGAEDTKHTITELKNAIISLGGNI